MHRLTSTELIVVKSLLPHDAVTQVEWCSTRLVGNIQYTLVELTTEAFMHCFVLKRDVNTDEVTTRASDVCSLAGMDHVEGKGVVHAANAHMARLTDLLTLAQRTTIGMYTHSYPKTIPYGQKEEYWAKVVDAQLLADYLDYVVTLFK